jgi:exopolyphosphatase/guanosine-5'-triphosphate,3'-diphosphate pyrophosphatase
MAASTPPGASSADESVRPGGARRPPEAGISPSAGASPAAGEVLACFDIGTNSVRLMVVRLEKDGVWSTLTVQKEPVRLGEGEFGGRSALTPEAMDRGVLVCRTFGDLARAHGASDFVAVATSATREAANQGAFVRRLRAEAGLDVHVVSGKEEARLIFLGLLAKVHVGDKRALVVDIGGGSTEIALGDVDGPSYLASLRLGAIRLSAEITGLPAGGRVPGKAYEQLLRRVQTESARVRRDLDGQTIDAAYGTSGTIRNLASVVVRTLRGGTPQREDTITRGELAKTAKLLRGLDLEERRRVAGLNPLRADIVVAGAAILEAVMEDLGLEEIHAVAECGLREGLVVDHLARVSGAGHGGTSVRERSVLQLARACSFDEPHARQVQRLALELFDSAAEARLHSCTAADRELLAHAALLHDIGTFLSYTDHHLHSHYLIRNAELVGFDEQEVAIVAAAALFHRKSRPGARHTAFADLDATARERVRMLSALLRLAEYLDRGHAGAVYHATLRRDGARALVLEVRPGSDWHLERWRLEERRETLEKALRRSLRVLEV